MAPFGVVAAFGERISNFMLRDAAFLQVDARNITQSVLAIKDANTTIENPKIKNKKKYLRAIRHMRAAPPTAMTADWAERSIKHQKALKASLTQQELSNHETEQTTKKTTK